MTFPDKGTQLMCQCEHVVHDHRNDNVPHIRGRYHKYLAVPSGNKRAEFVGFVCDLCASDCMKNYLLTCINCSVPIEYGPKDKSLGRIYSNVGEREYHISGLCETCFDNIAGEFDYDENEPTETKNEPPDIVWDGTSTDGTERMPY